MLITNFASGELSDSLNGRVDIQQYYQGAKRIENFEIIPTGGIKRRVGTQRIAQLSGNHRIIPFIVDKNSVFILELGIVYTTRTLASLEESGTAGEYAHYNNKLYKYVDSSWTEVAPGKIVIWQRTVLGAYEIKQTIDNIPWESLAEIKEVQYAQNFDTMVFVHKSYRPFILKLTGNTFEASVMEFDFIPDVSLTLDDDFDYVMVVYDHTFPVKNGNTFTYTRLINGVPQQYPHPFAENITDFYCIVDGKLYKWNVSQWELYGQDPDIEEGLFTTATKYPGCVAFFNNRLYFASTMHKPQMVWASAAPDNYGTKYNDFCTYKKYVTVNRVVKDADLHIFSCDIAQANIDTVQHRTTLTNVTQDFSASGALKETVTRYFVSSGLVPVGTKVISVTSNTIVIDTDKIAVQYTEGHTVESNVVMSIQLWRTVDTASAEDYEYMVVSNNITTADCGLFFELASDQNDGIKFLSSNRFLAVGTESSIWSIDPGISALSINAVMQGRYGSDEIQGQAVETATVYFAQGKKGIREFYYDGESNAFRTNNIALLADHILRESAAQDFDYMTNPYSRLIIVREDGTVAAMLYDKTNGIMAWNHIILDYEEITSCAVTRGYDENDLIFFVVKDNDVYYLELLDYGNELYLDSWKVYDTEDEHPADGYTTGAIIWNKTRKMECPYDDIPTGFIEEGNELYIGYKFKSYIKSMPIIGKDPSKPVRISKLQVRFLNSFMPIIKVTGLPEEKFNTIQEPYYSGVAYVNYPGQTNHDVCFELEAGELVPVNILSVDAQTA